MKFPINPPGKVEIARELCALPFLSDELDNYERGCLESAFGYLSEEPPNIQRAKETFAAGVAHAFRGRFREERPETWLVAACAELLRDEGQP